MVYCSSLFSGSLAWIQLVSNIYIVYGVYRFPGCQLWEEAALPLITNEMVSIYGNERIGI